MKKQILFLFLAAVSFSFFGCLPVDTKIVVPEYDKTGEYKSSGGDEDAPSEKTPQKVPEILLDSSGLKQDGEYQKHDKAEIKPAPAREEDLTPPGGIQGQPQDLVRSHISLKLPDSKYVSYRLNEYTKALREWNGLAEKMVAIDAGTEWPDQWHECVQGLEYMVFGYKRVQALVQPGTSSHGMPQGGNPWDIVQRDVRYLESDCGAVFQQGTEFLDTVLSGYGAQDILLLETLLEQFLAKGDCRGALSAYENSTDIRLGEDVDFTAHALYAQALLCENRFAESLHFMEAKLRQARMLETPLFNDSRDAWQAVMRYAELLMIMGQDRKAKSVYLQLDDLFAVMEKDSEWVAAQLNFLNDYKKSSEQYDAFLLLLSEYVQYNGRGIPVPFQVQYERILADYDDIGLHIITRQAMRNVEEQARQWATIKLQEVDYLAHEKDFQSARKVLETIENIPLDMTEEVAQVFKSLARQENEDAEMRRSLEKERLAERWENAVELFESEKYEEAIEAFSFLSATVYGQEAEGKVQKAVDLLTVRLRKEAADLFVSGRMAQDPVKKSNMMMQSRDILLYILKRYPEAKIGGKVEENLRVLEEQIHTFNPNLLAP